jgi:uncharacterized protein
VRSADGARTLRGGRGPRRLALVYTTCVYSNRMSRFEWDEHKAHRNLEVHGLSFEDAHLVLGSPCMVGRDPRHEEQRFIAIGSLRERLVVVVFTVRGSRVRIISMRKANKREQAKFESQK